MCNFLSALVMRNGEVLCNPLTDSHSDLIAYFSDRGYSVLLGDNPVNADHAAFIRVEFSPPSLAQAADVTVYALRVDEEFTPGWFDDEVRAAKR